MNIVIAKKIFLILVIFSSIGYCHFTMFGKSKKENVMAIAFLVATFVFALLSAVFGRYPLRDLIDLSPIVVAVFIPVIFRFILRFFGYGEGK